MAGFFSRFFRKRTKEIQSLRDLVSCIEKFLPGDEYLFEKAIEQGTVPASILLEMATYEKNIPLITLALTKGGHPFEIAFHGEITGHIRRLCPVDTALKSNFKPFFEIFFNTFTEIDEQDLKRLAEAVPVFYNEASEFALKGVLDKHPSTSLLQSILQIAFSTTEASLRDLIFSHEWVQNQLTSSYIIENRKVLHKGLTIEAFKNTVSLLTEKEQNPKALSVLLMQIKKEDVPYDFLDFFDRHGVDINEEHCHDEHTMTLTSFILRSGNEPLSLRVVERLKSSSLRYSNKHLLVDAAIGGRHSVIKKMTDFFIIADHHLLMALERYALRESCNRQTVSLLARKASPALTKIVYNLALHHHIDAIEHCFSLLSEHDLEGVALAAMKGFLSASINKKIAHHDKNNTNEKLHQQPDEKTIHFFLDAIAKHLTQKSLDIHFFRFAENNELTWCRTLWECGANPSALLSLRELKVSQSNAKTCALIMAAKEDLSAIISMLYEFDVTLPKTTDTTLLSSLSKEGIRLLLPFGIPLPANLTDEDIADIFDSSSLLDVIHNLTKERAHLLPDLLPRLFKSLDLSPLDYLSECPDWHKAYVLPSIAQN